ncbi:transposase [Methylobacterium sp. CM6247]
MWTDRHQTRHEARLKDMVLQAGLDEVAGFLERADPPIRPDATAARHVLAGIAWHLRTGGGWRALPAGFPPWRTVYGRFRRWIEKGLFESLMRGLARRQRRRCGRRPDPRLAIIDTQSVKCIGVRGPRGYDGAKKLVGRKRVALVDAEGHVLALAVLPANVQDRDTLPALDAGKENWPSLTSGPPRRCLHGSALPGVVQPPRHAPPSRRKVA